MLVEMRVNRVSMVLVTIGCGLCLLAGLQMLGAFASNDPLERTVARAGCSFLGQWGIAAGLITYARHVFLDAQGLLKEGEPRKKKTRAKAKETTAEGAEEKSAEKDKKPTATKPAAAVAKGTTAADDDEEEDEDDLSNDRQLSRSERKRLKKMQQSSPTSQRRAA
jgi:hypothetical protein